MVGRLWLLPTRSSEGWSGTPSHTDASGHHRFAPLQIRTKSKRKSGIFWPREWERCQNNILVPQHVDTFMPRTILTNFGACSSQIWHKKSLNFWGLNDRPILGATHKQPRSEMGIMPHFWLLVVRDSNDRKKYSPHSETGSCHSVMGRRQKNSKSGSPRSKKEFVPIQGLKCILC